MVNKVRLNKKLKVLIFGSGSIGTHHANAAVSLNCEVFITDKKDTQLINMRENIYPGRYGKWNKKINIISYNQVFFLKHYFDIIIIGVPPKNHLSLIKLCKKNLKFKKILVEKPLCVYNENYNFLKKKDFKDKVFCGYNHSISKSFLHFVKSLENVLKKNKSNVKIDIEWKESFDLILKAHPWIDSLNQSYLSNLKIGGGVSHEYSHAIHLFIILKELLFKNNTINFKKKIQFKKAGKFKYDNFVHLSYFDNSKELNLTINSKNNPAIKKISVDVGGRKFLNWHRLLEKQREIYSVNFPIKKNKIFLITRRKDFINELELLLKKNKKSIIKYLNLDYAIKVNLLLKKMFKKNV